MSFLNKMLASVGIGAAKVDTQLDSSQVRLGEALSGRVVVRGGNIAQTIEHINLYIMTQYKHDDVYHNHAVHTQTVSGRLDLNPGETREIPFRFSLGYNVPLSMYGTKLWVQTGAAISAAVDPGDSDALTVLPNAPVEAFLKGAERLGLRFKKAEIEYSKGRFVQELEFVPPYGAYSVSEVEFVLFPQADRLGVIIEVDRRAKGMAALFVEEFESRTRWELSPQLIAAGPDAIAQELGNRIRNT